MIFLQFFFFLVQLIQNRFFSFLRSFIANSFDGNSSFNSVNVSEELSHPIKGFLVGSFVINSKIHLLLFRQFQIA
jgi:hypothetical protein